MMGREGRFRRRDRKCGTDIGADNPETGSTVLYSRVSVITHNYPESLLRGTTDIDGSLRWGRLGSNTS
jgi:hypothetical protein